MILERLKIESAIGENINEDIQQLNVDTLHVDIQRRDYDVHTYGGEYYHNCEDCGECDISYYGIQIEDFSIEISAKTALNLYHILKDHLKTCGHDV